jgi:hypothetical protein
MTSEGGTLSGFQNVVCKFTSHTVQKPQNKKKQKLLQCFDRKVSQKQAFARHNISWGTAITIDFCEEMGCGIVKLMCLVSHTVQMGVFTNMAMYFWVY